MTLEDHYRRLLAVYPREHRLAYEEEMIGVLLAGAEPGRRRPTLAEAADLLWSGLAARTARGGAGLRGPGWRDTAAVVGVLTAGILAAVAARRLVWYLWGLAQWGQELTVARLLSIDPALRVVAWTVVVVAALTGLRRTAAGMALAATVIEFGLIVVRSYGWLWIDTGWLILLAPLTAVLLTLARRGRTATAVLGRRGVALAFGAIGLAGAATVLSSEIPFGYAPLGHSAAVYVAAGYATAGAALTAGLWRAGPRVRRRLAVTFAAVLAVPFAQERYAGAAGMHWVLEMTGGNVVLTQALFLVGLPALAALAVLGGWEAARRCFRRGRPGDIAGA
ncbi:hypothetical protein [Couchioplanes azureus]|uniref:hypothetical protein n=1 Tax=Couchioplanes caeruleus TaxID=56438 RepID=UPI00166F6659|nr:hypothetical protein [Couchioplanes caeruleus]GGQ39265.1 hypothetical protein GCM10010166_02510 [Couchioplanes caeruleus subsp. azureus]